MTYASFLAIIFDLFYWFLDC